MGSSRRVVAAIIAAVLLLGLSACGVYGSDRSTASSSSPPVAGKQYSGPTVAGMPSGTAPEAQAADAAGPAKAALAERLVIRNANLRLEVPKVLDGVAKLRTLASRFEGVVSNLQLASDTGDVVPPQPVDGAGRIVRSGLPFNASLTVLVPVAKFDAFRAEAEKLGTVLSENAADQDVTQEHVDLKARLANSKAEEARLRSFFDSAKSVTDMLSIERELARVRGDIESMTAQLATMERQAAMATLTIELVEPKPIVRPSTGIDWGFGEALTTGIQGLANLLKAAIVVIVATAPLWLLAVAAVLLVRWRLRVRRSRQAQAAESES